MSISEASSIPLHLRFKRCMGSRLKARRPQLISETFDLKKIRITRVNTGVPTSRFRKGMAFL